MSNTQLTRYLDVLLEKQFIEEKDDGKGKQYFLTENGAELLDPLHEVITLIHEK